MNIAVLSLCRDRLDYTQHCFGTLLENAGCDFDWWVTDNGSTDGTSDWLHANTDATVVTFEENAGICPALNVMLEDALVQGDYDVIVKVDNDCEFLTPNTLRDVCEVALRYDAIVSPWIRGLREPPIRVDQFGPISVTPVIGGIFMATPAWMFKKNYRHPETTPLKDGDDYHLCRAFQSIRGIMGSGVVGYVDGYEANHYLTTDGQWADKPDYFARREFERKEANRLVTF